MGIGIRSKSGHSSVGARLNFVIADDHPMVRQGVRMMLELEYPGGVFQEADTFAGVLEAASASPRAVLLIDLDMPGMVGVESLRALRRMFPDLRIAVHSGSGDRQMILDALGAGMNGYILKASPVEELLYAVATVLAGRIYVTEQFSRAAGPVAPPADAPVDAPAREPAGAPPGSPRPAGIATPAQQDLTRRETEVLMCLLRGQSNKHIARELGIGEGTVKVHLASIFKSLGARNRTEAALIAAERGILPRLD